MTKRIMCFGDSLTWGWIPVESGVPTERYPLEVRWTGQMMAALGDGYELIEEGLSGRTTDIDDPTDPRLNGAKYLPSALATHLPLDLVIVMVGTNDTKAHLHRTPFEIVSGMSVLLGQIASSAGGVGTSYPAPKALLLAPPVVADRPNAWFGELFIDGPTKSAELGRLYGALAEFLGVPFIDVAQLITTDGVDGIHWTPENNEVVGKAVAEKVREILG